LVSPAQQPDPITIVEGAQSRAIRMLLQMGERQRAGTRYFFFGTLLPSLRASERAIAIACVRLFTLPALPPGPLLAVPRLKLRISLSTSWPTPGEYFRFLFFAIESS
jgi:hypothetical protein